MSCSIIIVSFNTSSLLEKCLKSVETAVSYASLPHDAVEVLVVDNASTDGSVEMVREKFPRVHILCNRRNVGFSKANNHGIQHTKGDSILLLNSDAALSPDTLLHLLSLVEAQVTIGVVGCKILNTDSTVQHSAGYFPTLIRVVAWMFFLDDFPFSRFFISPYHVSSREFYDAYQTVDWVTGACMLVRRSCIHKAGFLDEKIFMYGEEVEWCWRIKKHGYDVVYTPRTTVVHVKGASSGHAHDAGIVEEFRSILYFFRTYFPAWQYPILRFVLRAGSWLRILLFGIIGRDTHRAHIYAQAYSVV